MTKEEVLSLLLTAGEPVSGEHICRQLGVTRAAVWKAIDQLRQEGYTIEAAPRRGYTLTARPDRLDTAQVRGYLAGHPWQPLVTAVERVDSTNNACKRLAAEGTKPDVIVVDPPRKGVSLDVIEAMVTMGPKKIVYVSCDPATLARDVKLLEERGYRAVHAEAVDLFPRCAHVETVVLLSRVHTTMLIKPL